MKLKRFFTAVAATAMTVGSCLNVFANEQITVPITIDTGLTSTISGYIAELEYDPTVLEPVVYGTNNLSEDNYAAPSDNLADRGIFTASALGNKVTVGWADRVQYDLENGTNVANVIFNVLDDTINTTSVKTKLFELAKYPDVMDSNTYEYSQDIELLKRIEIEPVTFKNMGEDGDCLPDIDPVIGIAEETSTETTTEKITETSTETTTEETTKVSTNVSEEETSEASVSEEVTDDETTVSEDTVEDSQLTAIEQNN